MNPRLHTPAGLAVLFLGLFCAGAAHAQTTLEQCAAIDDDARRLECFDRVARERSRTAPASAPAEEAAPAQAPQAAQPAQPAEAPQPARTTEPAPSAEESFGAEQTKRPEPDEIKSLRTHIAGYFDGFSGGTEVTLANGQVWVQIDSARLPVQKRDPEVVIEKGFFGGYRLSVDGLNRSIRVRRIK